MPVYHRRMQRACQRAPDSRRSAIICVPDHTPFAATEDDRQLAQLPWAQTCRLARGERAQKRNLPAWLVQRCLLHVSNPFLLAHPDADPGPCEGGESPMAIRRPSVTVSLPNTALCYYDFLQCPHSGLFTRTQSFPQKNLHWPATAELASNFRSAIERARLGLVIDCPSLPHQVYVDADMWEKVGRPPRRNAT